MNVFLEINSFPNNGLYIVILKELFFLIMEIITAGFGILTLKDVVIY